MSSGGEFEAAALDACVPQGEPTVVPDKSFERGRTLPLKLQTSCGELPFTGSGGVPPRIVNLTRTGAAIDLLVLDPDAGDANNDGLDFRASGEQWIYDFPTRGLATGSYEISIETADGRTYTGAFILR